MYLKTKGLPITSERVMEAVMNDDLTGFCIDCGEETSPVEPDARKYECPACDEHGVYGAEELLIHLVA